MQQAIRVPGGLPEPDPESAGHSRRVGEHIRAQIVAAGGAISFGEFMQAALYAPGLGYYTAGAVKFGAAGDFVTAPELSPLFGDVVARQCAQTLLALDAPSILELGAGSGALAVSVLKRLAELDALPERYRILEVSPDLVERQQRRVAEELGPLASRVEWLDSLPSPFDGVIIGNEVLDALPVERFERQAKSVSQEFVSLDGSEFCREWRPAGPQLARAVDDVESGLGRTLAEGYRSEVSLGMRAWLADVLGSLGNGLCLLIDYGVSQREYYAHDRNAGWLRCHFQHRAHSEPLVYPGIQDLTSWVDFSAVAHAAVAAGARVGGFVTQAMFLLSGGLDNAFADFATQSREQQIELARQVKLLTLPGEMGENFKGMALMKGDALLPDAFHQGDRAHTL